MKNLFYSFTVLFLFAVNVKAQIFPINTYIINKTSEAMSIDGALNESSWNHVPFTEDFILLDGSPATLTTKAKVLWSDTHLYFAFVIADTSIWATYTKKDDYIFKQDAIEILIDPNGDSLNYAEIGFAPNEIDYDLLMSKPYSLGGPAIWNWNISGLMNKVTVQGNINTTNGGEQWICEVSLPFAGIPFTPVSLITVPKSGDMWRMNFARVDHNLDAIPTDQNLFTWTYTDGKDNHVPHRFGKVTFSATDAALSTHEFNTSSLSIKNHPNPFTGSTQFVFNSSTENTGTIFIYDVMGKEVDNLSLYIQSGQNSITWNAKEFSAGIYFYRLSIGNEQQTGKLQIQ